MVQKSHLKIQNLVDQFETGIRAGRIAEVWSLLQGVTPSQIPREYLIRFADFGRRVQQPIYTLKILGKLIRAHREGVDRATPEEVFSYVGALVKLGFYDESRTWLDGFSAEEHPQILDLKARIQMARWNYRSSAFYFRRFLNSLETESYPWQVASLNVSASLISSGRAEEALPILRRLRGTARRQKSRLILGNAWELQAQADMELERLPKARKALENSLRLLGRTQSIWSFYTRKWNHLFDLKEGGEISLLLSKHEELQQEALRNHYWEDLRELERAMALYTGDRTRVLKVYFGTPYEFYRTRLLQTSSLILKVPEEFLFPVGQGEPAAGQAEMDRTAFVKSHSVCGRLLELLTHDMYRPVSLGYVFSNLYLGEFFDPFHSPGRVASAVQRLRQQVMEHGIHVAMDSTGMRLSFQSPGWLRLQKSQNLPPMEKQKLVDIRDAFGKRWFQRKDIEKQCQVSGSTASRWLETAQKTYSVEVFGAGRSRRYRFR